MRAGILPGMSAQPAPLPVTRQITSIVLHCSATPSGQWVGGAPTDRGYETCVTVIDRWHAARGFKRQVAARSAFNWRLPAIGYHFVVDLDGQVWTGRHPNEIGAHVAGFNAGSLGVCLIGGAERDARYTAAQWAALRDLVRELAARFDVSTRPTLYPRSRGSICGHRDLSPDQNNDGRVTPQEWLKTCPGFDVSAWLERGMESRPEQVFDLREP